jgi:hypothetical protein
MRFLAIISSEAGRFYGLFCVKTHGAGQQLAVQFV